MKRALVMNQLQDNHNMQHGKERMLNMLIKLMLLMKHQKLFNIYKLVLHLLNLRADLKKSKLN
jgi:hypothetical protein